LLLLLRVGVKVFKTDLVFVDQVSEVLLRTRADKRTFININSESSKMLISHLLGLKIKDQLLRRELRLCVSAVLADYCRSLLIFYEYAFLVVIFDGTRRSLVLYPT
jgi:hypothetical protein